MNITHNQKVTLIPRYEDKLYEPYGRNIMSDCLKQVIEPIWTSDGTGNVKITCDNGNEMNDEEVCSEIIQTMDDYYKTVQEKSVTDLYKNCLSKYAEDHGSLAASKVFIAQANGNLREPMRTPSPTCIYVMNDLKDACDRYVRTGGKANGIDDSNIIVNAAFTINQPCLMMYFNNKSAFDNFKEYVKTEVNALSAQISNQYNGINADTMSKFSNFASMKFDSIEGVLLRTSDQDDCEPYSFSRILIQYCMDYALISDEAGLIVSDMKELLHPQNLILLDCERIAKIPSHKFEHALNAVIAGIETKYMPLSKSEISKLSSAVTIRKRASARRDVMNAMLQGLGPASKRRSFKFKKFHMARHSLDCIITAIVNKECNVTRSENYCKSIKTSFMRPSRRNPDDYNIAGKAASLTYKPDIHIYLDTSGSISEENYKHAIMTLIYLAKKMNINLYFNSFSDKITRQTKLHIKGKTLTDIYREFQKVPKVSGGTKYQIVWDYIMRSQKRMNEISIMITDFEYSPPRDVPKYPTKLYYVPITTEQSDWDSISTYAANFCENMYHIDPNIRKHLLMA